MRYFFAFWLAIAILGVPFFVRAETEACACYCKSGGGADLKSGGTADEPTPDTTLKDCSNACKEAGEVMLGCYGEAQTDSLPKNNLRCWTEYECTTQVSTDPLTADDSYDWGGQATSCPSGEGECYAPMAPVTLGVAIDDLSSAKGLPEYVNAVYTWLIPAGALVGVVMIMIGGMQYIIARGTPKGIDMAKDRIRHAVEGMILLMFAYFILNLIDADLVTFPSLRVPQIRRVVYLDPSSTCEYMMAYGLTITSTTGTSCGNTGTIESTDGWVGSGEPSVSVGDTCNYSSCTDSLATCVSSATADGGYACVRCANAANDTLGNAFENAPAPSESTCGTMTRAADANSPDEHQYCEYYDAYAGAVTDADACAEIVYPAADRSTSLDCARLKADAEAGDSRSCRAYDLVWAITQMVSGTTVGMYSNELDDKLGDADTYPLLESICEEDPCGLAPPGDTCKTLVVEEDILNTFCSIPGMDAFPLCAATSSGVRGDCVTKSYYDQAQIFLYSTDLTAIYDAYQALELKDNEGTVVDFNPTW